MEQQNNYAGSSLALSFTVGGLVGASLAILLAPWEGRQTREKIRELAGEVKEKSSQLSSQWKEKTSAFLEKRKTQEEGSEENPEPASMALGSETGSAQEMPFTP